MACGERGFEVEVRLQGEVDVGREAAVETLEATLRENLPPLLAAVRDSGHPVVWACDPMHGNTYTAPNGRKTRHFDDICREVEGFFGAHSQVGTWAGGIHIELTGEDRYRITMAVAGFGESDLELEEGKPVARSRGGTLSSNLRSNQ